MTARFARGCCALYVLCLIAASCSFDKSEHRDFCRSHADCDGAERCLRGFCVMGEGSGGDAAVEAGAACAVTGMAESCYDGLEGTADRGICKRGERLCIDGTYTQCLGQVGPLDETCNGQDDDCDGRTDEIDEPTCATGMDGVCGGGELTCRGSFAVCEALRVPDNESCNATDDDCDGEVDEVASTTCYPMAAGCTSGDDGVTCLGLCRTGTTRCDDGVVECRDAVLPETEACTSGGGSPVDEDCDGQVDEGCPCTTGAMRPCYAGPDGTEDEGSCTAGTQTCIEERWGGCQGQVLPVPESCQNTGQDDDCNGVVDDLEGVGDACIDSNEQGQCRLGTIRCDGSATLPSCVTREPEPEQCDPLDHNCDGDPYDGVDFTSNQTCGSCDNQCSDAEMCCAGDCQPPSFFAENPEHCGACNTRCGDAEVCCQGQCVRTGGWLPPILLGGTQADDLCSCESACTDGQVCCFDTCVDLDGDPENCGFCGNACNSDTSREQRCERGACVSP